MIEEHDLRAAVETEFGVSLANAPYGSGASGFVGRRAVRYRRGAIGKWLAEQAQRAERGETVACLVPARVDTRWWWEHVRRGHVRFLKSRVRFVGERSGAPFPSAVVVFGAEWPSDSVGWWNIDSGELSLLPVRSDQA